MKYKISFFDTNKTMRYPAVAIFQCFIHVNTKTHFFQCVITDEEECDATIFNNSKERHPIVYININYMDMATYNNEDIDSRIDFISDKINEKDKNDIQQFFHNNLMSILYITHCIAHGI